MSWKDIFYFGPKADYYRNIQESLKKPRVIVLTGEGRLNDEQIAKALQGNLGALWYQAIVSKIEGLRESNLLEASRAASANNSMAMAGAVNVYEALTALLDELDGYVRQTKGD